MYYPTHTRLLLALLALQILLLGGCSSTPPRERPVDPDVARAEIRARIPPAVANRDGWAIDLFAAFEALDLRPTPRNVCAVVAVIQQETGPNWRYASWAWVSASARSDAISSAEPSMSSRRPGSTAWSLNWRTLA